MFPKVQFLVFISVSMLVFPKPIDGFITLDDLWRNLTATIDPLSHQIDVFNNFRVAINEKVNQIDAIIQKEIHDVLDKVNIVEHNWGVLKDRVDRLEEDYIAINNKQLEEEGRLNGVVYDQNIASDNLKTLTAKVNGISHAALPAEIAALPSRVTGLEHNNKLWQKNFKVIKNAFEKNKKVVGGCGNMG